MPLNDKLDDAEIRIVVREAEIGVASGEDPKAALVKSVSQHVASKLATETAQQVNAAIDLHVMLAGDYDGTNEWIGTMQAIVTPVCNKLEIHTTLSYGDTPGVMAAPDGALRTSDERYQQLLALFYPAAQQVLAKLDPLPPNRGKFLARYGVVKQHIDAITPPKGSTPPALAATHTAPPPPSTPQPAPAFSLDDMPGLGGGGATATTLPPPGHVFTESSTATVLPIAPIPPGDAAPPTQAQLREALMAFRAGTDVDDAGYAKRLGISRSTFHNYISGKTEKPKLTLEQARVIVADIDMRVAKLREAASMIERVR